VCSSVIPPAHLYDDPIETFRVVPVLLIAARQKIPKVSAQFVNVALLCFLIHLINESLGKECHDSTCYSYNRCPDCMGNLKLARVSHLISSFNDSEIHVGKRLLCRQRPQEL
jgi:hypothetical protein